MRVVTTDGETIVRGEEEEAYLAGVEVEVMTTKGEGHSRGWMMDNG